MSPETFLVTGGSGGIGGAVCRGLAKAGYCPIVGYATRRQEAEKIARDCGGVPLALDLADDQSIDAAIDALAGGERPLAGVVLAASPPPQLAPLTQIAVVEMERQWRINVGGPQRLLAGLLRRCFIPRKKGTVIGVLSRAMGDVEPRAVEDAATVRPAAKLMGAYAVAKYGQAGLLAVLAADYPWLRVRRISPGFTRTRMLDAFDPRFLALQEQQAPIRAPEEVAGDILRLIA